MTHEYRDRIYIRKDIIVKLSAAGELNQTKLLSYCGLNIVKHKEILDDMEAKGFIEKFSEDWENEIHPTPGGYAKLGALWRSAIEAQLG